MKLNYSTPLLQVSLISEDDVIRTSDDGIPAHAYFAPGEQGIQEKLEDYIKS